MGIYLKKEIDIMTTSFNMVEFDLYAYDLINYLSKLGYSKASIKKYTQGLERLKQKLISSNICEFNPSVVDSYVKGLTEVAEYKDLSRHSKDKIRIVNVLLEFTMTKRISFRIPKKKYNFNGEIGLIMQEYFTHRRNQNNSEKTLDSIILYLSRLHQYLMDNQINNIIQIKRDVLKGFINTLTLYSSSTLHCTLCALRGFLKFLFQSNYLTQDFSLFVPKDNYKRHAKLPTTYTENEVKNLIKSIDRANPKGKRDYAIILLAARLGLRSSDICDLKFENINWEENTVKLFQRKTCNPIELPLLVEIGNAIIDYLKYARPVSESNYVFLHQTPKYTPLKSPTIHSIVTQYMKAAKIDNFSKKKHGPHALRHSLAGRLLENKTPLPVISEVLGHSNSESTKVYLSIDIETLRECALDVPSLNLNFYGGDNNETL